MYTFATLPWWGWVIVVLVIAGFVFMGAWFAWLGRAPRMPPGFVQEANMGKFHVYAVLEDALLAKGMPRAQAVAALASASARAVRAAAIAWERAGGNTDALRRIVVYYVSDATFNSQPGVEGAAAYSATTGAAVGSGWPMAVVRYSYTIEVLRTGEPVIHEMMHTLLGDKGDVDRDHADPRVWAAHGEDTIQAAARQVYKAYPPLS